MSPGYWISKAQKGGSAAGHVTQASWINLRYAKFEKKQKKIVEKPVRTL
jgi:hypothetical protein